MKRGQMLDKIIHYCQIISIYLCAMNLLKSIIAPFLNLLKHFSQKSTDINVLSLGFTDDPFWSPHQPFLVKTKITERTLSGSIITYNKNEATL